MCFPALDCLYENGVKGAKQTHAGFVFRAFQKSDYWLGLHETFRSLSQLLCAGEGTMLGKVTGALPSSPLPARRMCGTWRTCDP